MSDISKRVCSAQGQHCAERAGSMEKSDREKRSRQYRSLKMQAASAWLFSVPLLLLSIFHTYVSYSSELRMLLAVPVLSLSGASFYADAWKQLRKGRITVDTLIASGISVTFLFSLFNTLFPGYWYAAGLRPHVYYEVAVLAVAIGLTGKVLRLRSGELHGKDRIAGILLPVQAGIAVFVFIAWTLFGGAEAVPHAFYAAASAFIVACPCALGLVTPVALMRAMGKAAGKGIRIKDALVLERLDKAGAVVFDKAGTLTEGHPTVTAWLWAQCQERHFKKVLLAAEMNSANSLAVAITAALQGEKIVPARLDESETLEGKGVRATYKGAEYWVGSHKLLKDYRVYLPDILGDMLAEYESEGNSIVYFGCGNGLLAIIAVKDRLKITASGVVRELREQELDICMLTGNGERTASTIAYELGITRYVSDASPEDKETFIRELRLQGKTVVAVGNGINDMRALACAAVGIVMEGEGGTAVAEEAMVAMKSSGLQSLPALFALSRHTFRLIRRNSLRMIICHLAGVSVAAGVLYPVYGILLTPMLAVAVIALSCTVLARR